MPAPPALSYADRRSRIGSACLGLRPRPQRLRLATIRGNAQFPAGLTMIVVEEVRRAAQRRRFHELGRVLFRDEPRWAPVLRSYEAWLFSRSHPYRRRADVVRFLARRDGYVVGRVCAHHMPGDADGWFGAFECADDVAAVRALIDAAGEWVSERGARTLAGPATFTVADEAGVLVDGFEHPGGTGRPWHPPRYVEHLRAAGLEPLDRTFPRWRLPVGRGQSTMDNGGPLPPHAGRLADPMLVLSGPQGEVAAIPDIGGLGRVSTLRNVGGMVRTEAAVVRLEGDPAVLVSELLAAAHTAGYRHVWAPWSPAERPPDTIHHLFGRGV